MPKKNIPAKTSPESSTAKSLPVVKYQRPKVLLIDVGEDQERTLKNEGYNVVTGSFGRPYRVPKSSEYHPVTVQAKLPNYTEQEIIIIDVFPDEPTAVSLGEKVAPLEELDCWAKCSTGVIDPRPRAMAMVKEQFDRILEAGGCFIIFSDMRKKPNFVWARSGYRGLDIQEELPYDNWNFLSCLSNLTITDDDGEEITPVKENWPLVRLLNDYLEGSSFCCTFDPQWHIEKQWIPLAKNKYGATVAGVIVPRQASKCGWILILPRLHDKAGFLASLLKNILPDLSPALFPDAEGQRWIYRPEYELSFVLEKAKMISDIQDDAARKIVELEKEIESERKANKFLFDLLRETGGDLVIAVQKALNVLGFNAIVDVDAEMKAAGNDAALREDLRIHDVSPVLVVDIKGVAGKPADAEALQAQKHAFIYIQEQNRADVRGLTIINHQRLLPPLERDNNMPFRKEILDNAAQVKLSLMTTWDLFRLVRGSLRYHWTPKNVMPIFYKTGRILPVPQHYEYIGKVAQVWKNAFSIKLDCGEIRLGDQVSVEFPVEFEEQSVESLRVDNADVLVAGIGTEVGLLRTENLPKVKVGFSVYHVNLV
jgi:hypothetical protein